MLKPEGRIKAILVGRHSLLESQVKTLYEAEIEIIGQVSQVPTEPQKLQEFINELKQKGVKALVVQALPLHLIAQLLQHFEIYIFKMEAIAVSESLEEAKKIMELKPTHRIILPSRVGEKESYRVLEFKGLFKIKEIKVVEEPVVVV